MSGEIDAVIENEAKLRNRLRAGDGEGLILGEVRQAEAELVEEGRAEDVVVREGQAAVLLVRLVVGKEVVGW